MSLAEILPFSPRSALSPIGVGAYRHGEKTAADGPLAHAGKKAAKLRGKAIGFSAADSGIHTIIQSGTVPRTIETAEEVEEGMQVAYRRITGAPATEEKIHRTQPQVDLSLSTIADSKESVLVQRYRSALTGVETALDSAPWYIAPFLRREKKQIEQAAVGKVLLQWLGDDDKRPLHDGKPDPHTRSAREVAQMQAYVLKNDLDYVVGEYHKERPVQILKYTHENMVLIWARYFLYQEKPLRRRGQPRQRLSGMEIVEKIGGKIPYLGGVHIHIFPQEDGSCRLRARFNNAWYEVDLEMIETLAKEQIDKPFLTPEYANSSDIFDVATYKVAKLRQRERQKVYESRGLAA